MAIGRVGSFATDSPLANNYIGQALTDTENQGFRYRQERRNIADAKKKEEEDKQTEISTGPGSIDQVKTSKFATHNALAIDGAGKLYKYIADKGRLYSQGKISKVEFEIAKQNAKAQISQMNQATERINGQVADYSKMIEQGKIASGFEQNALELGKAYDNVNMYFDEVGDDGILNVVAYDDNGKIIEKSGLAKFGQNAFTPVSAFDIDKDKSEFIKTYPKVLRENLGYTSKTGIKGITPEIENAIELKVDALVKDRNALANANYKRTGVPNPNVTDPEEIKKTKESLRQEYLAMYSPEETIEEATQRNALEERKRASLVDEEQARRNEAGRNERANKSNKLKVNLDKNKKPTLNQSVIGGVQVINNTKESNLVPDGVKNGSSVFSVRNMQILGPDGNVSEIIDKVYKNADGTMVFEGRAFDEKGVEFPIVISKPQNQLPFVNSINRKINNDGSGVGYLNLTEFGKDLEGITKSKESKSEPKKTILRSELASKAKASGYTTQEYEKLLKAKGITIK